MKTTIGMRAAAALLALAAGGAQAQAVVGQPAPAFSISDSQGRTVSLTDFKGRHVVLEWVNPGCPFVQKHYDSGNMQSMQKRAKELGVVWLSICSSAPGKQGFMTPEKHLDRVKDQKADPAAVLLDSDGKIGRSYGARTTPQMVLIDPKGVLLYNGVIDDKPTSHVDDIPKARNHIMSALDEALAGKAVSITTTRPYGCSVKY